MFELLRFDCIRLFIYWLCRCFIIYMVNYETQMAVTQLASVVIRLSDFIIMNKVKQETYIDLSFTGLYTKATNYIISMLIHCTCMYIAATVRIRLTKSAKSLCVPDMAILVLPQPLLSF